MWNSASGQWKASSSGLTNDWEKECNCIRLYCFTQNMIKGASQVSIARWSLLSPPFPDGLSIRKISVLLTSTIYWLKNISARFVWSQVLLAMCFKPGIWDIFWMKWHLMCTKFSYIDSVNSDSFFLSRNIRKSRKNLWLWESKVMNKRQSEQDTRCWVINRTYFKKHSLLLMEERLSSHSHVTYSMEEVKIHRVTLHWIRTELALQMMC